MKHKNDGSEHNQNNTCNGGQCQNKHNDCEGDECQNKNNNCDNDCQSNAIGFISYIQGGINREVDLIKQYGTQISSDECNKHINNIRQYIGSVSSKTSNYGSQWYGGDTGGAQVQISSVVSTINDLINYLLSAHINANVYSSVVPSLCNEVGSWFQFLHAIVGLQVRSVDLVLDKERAFHDVLKDL
ncbi:hypothetical protein MPER_10840 [Moniliophthora perniciosa FA553]|nr:hypothetical protein MPER_10840 [Moniliophthora perniciosa FA553]